MAAQFRSFAEIRSTDDAGDDLIVRGVASTGDLDRKGGFIDQASLWECAQRAGSIPIFWQHDWDAPIGRITRMFKGTDELHVEGKIGRDFDVIRKTGPAGGVPFSVNNIRQLIRQGIVNAFSIGFDAEKRAGRRYDDPPTYVVTDLLEVSVVTLAANDKTLFSFQRGLLQPRATSSAVFSSSSLYRRGGRWPRFQMADDTDGEVRDLLVALQMLDRALKGE